MGEMLVAGRTPRRFRGLIGVWAVIGAAAVIKAGSAVADAVPSTGAAPSIAAYGPNAAGPAATSALSSSTIQPPPAVASAKPVPLPPGQVWECMVNGQRTFSDVRCGAQSSIRQLAAVNIMDATPTRPTAPGFYQTGYAPRPVQPMSADNTTDDANDIYWGPAILAVSPRALHGHRAPRGNHGFGRPRRN